MGMMVASTVLAVVLAYLLGSIPTGYLVVRRLKGVDIRDLGDHSIGTTNVFSQVGLLAGAVTAAGDIAKGALAMLPTRLLPMPEGATILVALAAIGGHIWPLFLQFRGGAGLATTLGVILMALPREALLLVVPLVALAVVVRKRLVFGTVCSLFLIPLVLLSWWFGEPPALVALPVVLGAALVVRKYGRQIAQALQSAFRGGGEA